MESEQQADEKSEEDEHKIKIGFISLGKN